MHNSTAYPNTSLISAGDLKAKWLASYSWYFLDCRQRRSHSFVEALCFFFHFLHILKHDASVPLAFNMSVALRRCWDWQSCLFSSSSWIHVAQEQQTTNNSYRSTNHNHFVLKMKKIQNKGNKNNKCKMYHLVLTKYILTTYLPQTFSLRGRILLYLQRDSKGQYSMVEV